MSKIIEISRELFEAANPVPFDIFWSEPDSRYMTTMIHLDCIEYNGKWLGWNSALLASPAVERQEPTIEQYRVVRHDPRDNKYSDWFEINGDAKREQIAIDLRFTASRGEPRNYECRKLYTSPPAPVSVVPDGWKLVPEVATLDMKNAGWRECDRQGIDPESIEMQAVWTAMHLNVPTCLDKVKEMNQ